MKAALLTAIVVALGPVAVGAALGAVAEVSDPRRSPDRERSADTGRPDAEDRRRQTGSVRHLGALSR